MKKIKILGLLAMSAVMLTGCIDSMPNMTTEQSDLVSEYAAGLLLKYSPNFDYRLVSDEELAAAIAQEKALEEETMTETQTVAVPESTEAASEEKPEVQSVEEQETQESIQQNQQEFTDADTDLAVELGIKDGISLRYQSFELCDFYPQNTTGFSGIEAKEGKTLIVLHFDLENPSDKNVDCNLYDYALKIRLNVNQSVSAGVQETPILPDDMVSFAGNIEVGKKTDVVAVAEIEKISDDDIEELTIQMSSTNGNCNVKVR